MGILVGIVGLGAVSRFYINALHGATGFRLAAICDSNDGRLEFARELQLPVAREVDELLRRAL